MIEFHLWDHKYAPRTYATSQKLEKLQIFVKIFTKTTGKVCCLKSIEAIRSVTQCETAHGPSKCEALISRLDISNAHVIFLHCSSDRNTISTTLQRVAETTKLRVALFHFSDDSTPADTFWGYPEKNHFRDLVKWLMSRSANDEYMSRLGRFLSAGE